MDNVLKILITIVIIFALICVASLIRSSYELKNFVVKKYTLKSKVSKKCSFVLLSDLHNAEFGEDNEKLLRAIDDEKPDFICIAGDMPVGSKEADNTVAAKFVAELAKKYRIYYGTGNHENRMKSQPLIYGDAYERYEKQIDNFLSEDIEYNFKGNLIYLENESVDLDEYNITIAGLDIDQTYYNKIKRKNMEATYLFENLGTLDNEKCNILIAHHPRFYEAYCDYGADIILAGHYHGGTVRLPWVGGCIATDFRMLPKYEKGLFENSSTKMLVSGGLGTHTINVRLFNKPEIIVIELIPENEKNS